MGLTSRATDAPGAVSYFKRGCDDGDAAGCARLGEAYEKGAGVATDRARAVDLYRQACGDHDASACASLKRLHEAT
jgi:TPR repeat protein